jgi:arylsulfatase A-like enzyme
VEAGAGKNNTIHMKTKIFVLGSIAVALLTQNTSAQNITQQQQPFAGVIGQTFEGSKEAWNRPIKAPQGAPNVVWILLDDVGFGASGTFGGLVNTPTFDELANGGLRYTNFHTTAICAPTRAAILTGRNHHAVHMGGFAHTILAAGFPGYDGRIPSDKGTIAEVLRENGYNTFGVGKFGLTPDEDATDAGPFDRWPSGKGFDHFFGFLGSQTDQYKPDLVEDNAHVKPDGRHLNAQMTDKAISYIAAQKKAAPDKPFFLYYSPGATHAPHQVAEEWSNQYKGKFDKGWDDYREEALKRQKQLGVIPQNAVLPDRNPASKAWNTLTADEKKVYARFMEVYAGYLTYTDHEIGRVVNYLKEINQLDNTLIFVVIGDNGSSNEGTINGNINRTVFSRTPSTEAENIAYNLKNIDVIGKPEGKETNYPLGWSQATNTPFRLWKQVASSEGGTRNPLIIYYPKGIKEKGGIRTQYGHVIDLLPTTLDIVGIKYPEFIRGIKQDSLQGTSLNYSISDAKAPSKHTLQYYYIFGSRAIYKDGWKAAYSVPTFQESIKINGGLTKKVEPVWELYNLNEDFNERNDLAKKYPAKLTELKLVFDEQAKINNVYPLVTWDDIVRFRIQNMLKLR